MNRWSRIVLALLALTQLEAGLWALVAPRNWFDQFPGGGQHWVAVLPPYNEHLARDAGAGFLALGVMLAWAAVSGDVRIVRPATAAALVFALPHLAFHLAHGEGMPAPDNVSSLASLAFAAIVPAVLLALTWRRRENGMAVVPDTRASVDAAGVAAHAPTASSQG
ncbi:MAG TPA: hypothetical protein VH916_13490 [Dehalococcoidia bacterium]